MEEEKKEIIKKEETTTDDVKKEEIVEDPRKGLSITSMVLGIVSIIFISKNIIISIACGVLAVIFGIKSKGRAGKGMAKAGFIMGIISLSIIAVIFLFGLIGLALFSGIVQYSM